MNKKIKDVLYLFELTFLNKKETSNMMVKIGRYGYDMSKEAGVFRLSKPLKKNSD